MPVPVRILIACCSTSPRETIAEILRGWGADVVFAANVDEAQKILNEQTMSLVFCEADIVNGTFRDLLDAISRSRAAARLVALVHDEGGYRKAIQAGAFEAIPIPCQRSDVQWAVIRATRR